jgi:hypothetical protein
MTASRRSDWVACVLTAVAALLEIAVGLCLLTEVDHAQLGRVYIGLGVITFLGLHEMFEPETASATVAPPARKEPRRGRIRRPKGGLQIESRISPAPTRMADRAIEAENAGGRLGHPAVTLTPPLPHTR